GLLTEEDEAVGASMLLLGARGVLFPNSSLAEVIQAIREVHAGGAFCPPRVVRALLDRQGKRRGGINPDGAPHISPREAEVMGLAGLGLTTKEIALRLCIERDTARNHIHNVLSKLRVHTRREALQRLHRESNLAQVQALPWHSKVGES